MPHELGVKTSKAAEFPCNANTNRKAATPPRRKTLKNTDRIWSCPPRDHDPLKWAETLQNTWETQFWHKRDRPQGGNSRFRRCFSGVAPRRPKHRKTHENAWISILRHVSVALSSTRGSKCAKTPTASGVAPQNWGEQGPIFPEKYGKHRPPLELPPQNGGRKG